MTVVRRVIYDLVAGDTCPVLAVRFPDFDLSDYSGIDMLIRRSDTQALITKAMTLPSSGDMEVATVKFNSNDLVKGRHKTEFKFKDGTDCFRLPKRFPIILNVREEV